jgi:methionyl-tRNA formyltransferase
MQADIAPRAKIVFAGTPAFAVPSLRRLHADPRLEIVAVYTQPDRPAGRGRRAKPSAIKQNASDLSIPVYQPTQLTTAAEAGVFRSHEAELLVVAAYGLLLPQAIIEQPRLAANVHASLLPRWRGAAPIQRAIMAGDRETGISIMRIVEALDAGPVLLSRSCKIGESDTAGSIHDRLAALGAECLMAVIDDYLGGDIVEAPQNEAEVIYAHKITASDRELDWTRGAKALARQVRALNPSPVATMRLETTNIKVWSAAAFERPPSVSGRPAEIIAANDHGIDIATADGLLRITRLQPEGKRSMSAAEFVNGFRQLLFPD